MKAGVIIAIVCTIIFVSLVGVATGVFGFMILAVALNGYANQLRAAETAMLSYIAMTALSIVVAVFAGSLTIYLLSVYRKWNSASAAALSIIAFSVILAVLHSLCFVLAIVIAEAMRTK